MTLVVLYLQMLEKNPDARPQTANEVAETIRIWLEATKVDYTPRPFSPPRAEHQHNKVLSNIFLLIYPPAPGQ